MCNYDYSAIVALITYDFLFKLLFVYALFYCHLLILQCVLNIFFKSVHDFYYTLLFTRSLF